MTDVGILSLPIGSGALPISTIVGRGPSLRRVLGLDREGAPRASPSSDGMPWILPAPRSRRAHRHLGSEVNRPGAGADPDLGPEAPTPAYHFNDGEPSEDAGYMDGTYAQRRAAATALGPLWGGGAAGAPLCASLLPIRPHIGGDDSANEHRGRRNLPSRFRGCAR
jgi:hypothetical protein